MMLHDGTTDLMECLDYLHYHPTYESRRLHALEIIRNGADIHSVTSYDEETFLYVAIRRSFVDVVQLLLEKGIDVNAQNRCGNTALHVTCQSGVYVGTQIELVPMLLYHGADPWIRNNSNVTPLEGILRDRSDMIHRHFEEWNLAATIEHLYYYMFDQYNQFGLPVYALLKAAVLNLPIFQEMVGTIEEVDMDYIENTYVDIDHILTWPSENLRLLLDKFDYVCTALFLTANIDFSFNGFNKFHLENVYILVGCHLQREFIDWLKVDHFFLEHLFKNDAPLSSRENIFFCLLSYGIEIHDEIIEEVYEYCGYNELFKLLRFLDSEPDRHGLRQIIPRLVFEVNGNIQKDIEDPLFWVRHIVHYFKADFEPVLSYYCVPNLKDICCDIKVRENLVKKISDQPRIPLLVEMARNVFRKYFVQRLRIRSAKQFYQSLELLPISPRHRKIIVLETELY